MIDEREIVRQAVERLTPPEPPFERMLRRRDRRLRNQRIAAGVVGIAVFVGTLLLFARPSFDRSVPPAGTGPTVLDPDPDPAVQVLPPAGAQPSSPERGELVITFYGRPASSTTFHTGVLQVLAYADGRVISRDENGPPGYATRWGFFEQRLTPEGVELLGSEVISSGLFDRDRELEVEWSSHSPSVEGLKWGGIRVDRGDRTVSVGWSDWSGGFWSGVDAPVTPPTPEQATALRRLNDLFSDLTSVLPSSAWEDPELEAYVAPRYAICYDRAHGLNPPRGLEPSDVLNHLPAPAEDLLLGKHRTFRPNMGGGRRQSCSEVTIEEARLLDEILADAGVERHPTTLTTGALEYAVPTLDQTEPFYVRFEPILPHGQWSLFPG